MNRAHCARTGRDHGVRHDHATVQPGRTAQVQAQVDTQGRQCPVQIGVNIRCEALEFVPREARRQAFGGLGHARQFPDRRDVPGRDDAAGNARVGRSAGHHPVQPGPTRDAVHQRRRQYRRQFQVAQVDHEAAVDGVDIPGARRFDGGPPPLHVQRVESHFAQPGTWLQVGEQGTAPMAASDIR